MRIAFFSDVHSNLPALEAVLADMDAVGIDERYALGDLVGYAPWPNEVLERLQVEAITSVLGNYDEGTGFDKAECGCAYSNPIEEALGDHSFAWTKSHTSDPNKAWLRSLPREIRFEADGKRYLLVHGSPRKINEYLFEDKPDATFARIAEGADADVIVCGHTHRQYDKTVGAFRFINDGSAGKPKDGDARACWALLDTVNGAVEFHRVEYDVERTAQAILGSDLPHEFAAQVREARGYKPVEVTA
ncbi:MAG TPA: metallophosphoesterase family protein [Patescibacteria group bacterium]|nr:metallophosphoesterase family protein [Patescibacteria group bacterium]